MTSLGIDLGTSSVKAALVDDDGEIRAIGRASYDVTSPHPGWAESDPHAWLAATRDAVTAVAAIAQDRRLAAPTAVGFSGQMHGVVVADAALAPLLPAIVWADARSAVQAGLLARELSIDDLARLGSPAVPGFAATSVMWLRAMQPDVLDDARWLLQPKDWLRAVLGGAVVTDRSEASGTLLYDVVADEWSARALEVVGVDRSLLPGVASSTAGAGAVSLPGFGDLPTVVGGADTACVVAGLGLRAGDGYIAVGSGAQVVRVVAVPRSDASMRAHLFATAGHRGDGWYRLGAVQSAGLVLTRVLDWLGATEAEAEAALADGLRADDPVFVPHLAGERTPFMDPTLTGSWHGLRLSTGRGAMLRSALDAIAQSVALASEAVSAAEGTPPTEPLLLVGGGSTGTAFGQLLSDATGLALAPADDTDAAVVGAALLATGVATNPTRPRSRAVIEPDPARADLMRERRGRMVEYIRGQEAL